MLFTWSPDRAAMKYRLEVSASDSFTKTVDSVTTPLTSYAPLLTKTGYTNGGKLWWRLAVVDEGRNVGAYTTGLVALPRAMSVSVKGALAPRRRGTLIVTVRDAKRRAVRKALVRVTGAGAHGTQADEQEGRREDPRAPDPPRNDQDRRQAARVQERVRERSRRTAAGRPMSRSPVTVSDVRHRMLCERCTIADRPLSRLRGLLGRSELPAGEGLLLRPSPSIHTWFMRFPIDVLFLDRDLRVLAVRPEVRPWRMAWQQGARAVLELAAGEALSRDIRPGDQLVLYAGGGDDGR